jgi:hypothetical protein
MKKNIAELENFQTADDFLEYHIFKYTTPPSVRTVWDAATRIEKWKIAKQLDEIQILLYAPTDVELIKTELRKIICELKFGECK